MTTFHLRNTVYCSFLRSSCASQRTNKNHQVSKLTTLSPSIGSDLVQSASTAAASYPPIRRARQPKSNVFVREVPTRDRHPKGEEI